MLLMDEKKVEPVFVSIEWVANYLGLDDNVVWNMVVKESKIKYLRTGSGKRGSIRIYYEDFLRYIEENTVEPKRDKGKVDKTEE